eukprot:TRINITY_DN4113_c0_g1_i1.p1 TRINITY_DN4113_c0_g1~~TRINITY_DN4113_c0_g1_i1.p1  ORF type:complete len:489 (-),score=27.82 TRINITY_DN4113_c0_g1_i1:523-1845(-)
MREIVSIHCGQCGIQAGTSFWDSIAHEHSIDLNGALKADTSLLHYPNVYFAETSKDRYTPRAIFVDLDPASIDNCKSGPMAKFFAADSFISGKCSTGNNWAKAFYTSGPPLMDSILDQIHKRVEECDKLQGFQFTHAVGGGTGGGLVALLLNLLKEEYADTLQSTFTIYPVGGGLDTCLEPYNAVLSMQHMVEKVDMGYLFDNEALSRICINSMKKYVPTFSDYNDLMSYAMSGVTCSLRFPGILNTDLRKMAVNLVPFPRLHFMLTSVAPLATPQTPVTGQSLLKEAYQPSSVMCSMNTTHGRYLTACTMFRGKLSSYETEKALQDLIAKNSSYFTEWIPNNIKNGLCSVPSKGHNENITFIGNSMATQEIFKKITERFTELFRRKVYLYKYLEEGMDEMELTEAESNTNDLISEYQPCCCCCDDYENEEQDFDFIYLH